MSYMYLYNIYMIYILIYSYKRVRNSHRIELNRQIELDQRTEFDLRTSDGAPADLPPTMSIDVSVENGAVSEHVKVICIYIYIYHLQI